MRQYSGNFHGLLSMSAVTLIAVAQSEKTNKLIDDPDRDVMYHCLREYFSLGNTINKPRRWLHANVRVTGRPIL